MTRSILSFLGLVTILSLEIIPAVNAETLTYPDLVHRLTDLRHLAVPPPASEQGALASSHDRSSIYDAATDSYHHWDANGDHLGIIRKEGDEDVLMDVQGPGCIWRTWSARPESGHVKIYLDGESTPAVDLPFASYFDGKSAPFTRTNLVYQTPQIGWDNYTPISFSKSCKIVADKGWGMFYHFNYTLFAPGTVVPTLKLPLSAEDNAALDEADKILGDAGVNPMGVYPGEMTLVTGDFTVKAGETSPIEILSGSGAITALKVKFPLPTNAEEQKILLRQLVVRITWDDDKQPAVWSPLGDFFADTVIPAKYRNLVTGITDDGQWYTYWYMPYSSNAHVEVQNESSNPITMNWEVSHVPLTKSMTDSLLRFHAKWHRDAFLPQRKDRAPDWTLLTTEGKGRYVGTQLHVWNPRGGWWGEGDEKFFVDGEKFPSTFGTGSEDYFGFAWSSGTMFHRALHGQPFTDNEGNASLYRWHIADNIPFQTSFEGTIEKYFPNSRPTLYAAVAYWYLAPGGKDSYPEVPVADRIAYWAPPPPATLPANMITPATDTRLDSPEKDPQIIEAESMKPLLGDPDMVPMTGFGKQWSGTGQLWWRPQRIGALSENEFQAPKAGKYRLIARFTQARDYGIVQLSVNGTNVGPPLDLHAENVKPTLPVDVGTVDLKDGTNILGMEIVGSRNDGYMIGLDYIKLVPAP